MVLPSFYLFKFPTNKKAIYRTYIEEDYKFLLFIE